MRTLTKFGLLLIPAVALSLYLDPATKLSAQNQSASDAPKTAERQFKNIQVLKGIPADQLMPTMQFIAASLGVECEFCHVEHQMDKDDKKEKGASQPAGDTKFSCDDPKAG